MQTTPTATDLTQAVKKTLTSRAFERFIGLAIDNALAEASRADGGIKLLPPGQRTIEFDDQNAGLYFITPEYDFLLCLYHRRLSESSYIKISAWYGSEHRMDEQGRKWVRSIGPLICDDFGDLVEAAA